MENRLLTLAKNDLASAQDNLYRARSAAKSHNPAAEWGASGQTLQQIIDGYENWEREALEAVAQAEAR